MREYIVLSVGQAGIQVGNALWELFCAEHGIACDGESLGASELIENKTFFTEVSPNRYIPRAIMADLEPTVIGDIKCGAYRGLFSADNMLNGIEDGANNYARGYFTVGKKLLTKMKVRIRKTVEATDNFRCFMNFQSYGGGTGSGFGSAVAKHMHDDYSKKSQLHLSVFPSNYMSTSVVEPYNTVLCAQSSVDNADMVTLFSNERLYALACDLGITQPTYNNINRIVANAYGSITSSIRCQCVIDNDLNHLLTNGVPYPKIHFFMTSCAPLVSVHKGSFETCTPREITKNLFTMSSQMINCDVMRGKFMTCLLQFRGLFSPRELNQGIQYVKSLRHMQFVDWCPTGFKLGLCNVPSIYIPQSGIAKTSRTATAFFNHTSIVLCWKKLRQHFKYLFKMRAFMHWYVGEGMEEGEFQEAETSLDDIVNDYEALEVCDKKEDATEEADPDVVQHVQQSSENVAMDEAEVLEEVSGVSEPMEQEAEDEKEEAPKITSDTENEEE